MHRRALIAALLFICILVGCQSPKPATSTVTLIVDGTARVVPITIETTVSDVLHNNNITLGDLDRVNPQLYSRIENGTTIKVVRVREETEIQEEDIPFQRQTAPNDSLPAGQTQLLQPGVNGKAQVTYRVVYEDNAVVDRREIRRVEITSPKDEIVMVGSQGDLPTVTVNGTLAYISSGNAWIIRQNSANKRALTDDGRVDGRIFELSNDGRRLLFWHSEAPAADDGETSEATPGPTPTSATNQPFNSLWVVLDTMDRNSKPIRLDLTNILYADWVPGDERSIVYSTAEPRATFPGWQANNDLWIAQISPTGAIINPHMLLEPATGGIYGWYGTFFKFSPDGTTLAWAQQDAIGVLQPAPNPEETLTPTLEAVTPTTEPPTQFSSMLERRVLASFAPRNAYDFVWRPGLSWSPDSQTLVTTTHGDPISSESPEDSPVYNVSALALDGAFTIELVNRAGAWSLAQYAPAGLDTVDASQLAYLQASNPLDSVTSRYQLVLMDRDGSNRHVVFPLEDQPGLSPNDLDYKGFVWSPDGRQIALIYQGNLFLVDVITGLKQQVTQDGRASSPRWKP